MADMADSPYDVSVAAGSEMVAAGSRTAGDGRRALESQLRLGVRYSPSAGIALRSERHWRRAAAATGAAFTAVASQKGGRADRPTPDPRGRRLRICGVMDGRAPSDCDRGGAECEERYRSRCLMSS